MPVEFWNIDHVIKPSRYLSSIFLSKKSWILSIAKRSFLMSFIIHFQCSFQSFVYICIFYLQCTSLFSQIRLDLFSYACLNVHLLDLKCPVCNKILHSDTLEVHLVECLAKPRISYNGEIYDHWILSKIQTCMFSIHVFYFFSCFYKCIIMLVSKDEGILHLSPNVA